MDFNLGVYGFGRDKTVMNRKVISKLLMCIAIVVMSVTARAEAPAELKAIVEKTIASNPEVQARFHNYLAAIQDQKAAKGGYYPHADIISTFRSQESLTSNLGNTESPDSLTQLALTQMLFDGFATPAEVNRLGHMARVRYYELQASMQEIAMETVKAYVDLQRYRKLIGFAESNYAVHQQLFDRIEERVTAGIARRVDLEQASGRFSTCRSQSVTEMTNLQNVTARYQRLTNELPAENLPEATFVKEGFIEDANPVIDACLSPKSRPAFSNRRHCCRSTRGEGSAR